jgi:hypothetical protein
VLLHVSILLIEVARASLLPGGVMPA